MIVVDRLRLRAGGGALAKKEVALVTEYRLSLESSGRNGPLAGTRACSRFPIPQRIAADRRQTRYSASCPEQHERPPRTEHAELFPSPRRLRGAMRRPREARALTRD
jgi:hypothetical protein